MARTERLEIYKNNVLIGVEEHELTSIEVEAERLQALANSDKDMARVAEDVAVAMITGDPLPKAAKEKINARRRLRGEADV